MFLHGWISDPKCKKQLVELYKPKKYIIEQQIDFQNEYDSYVDENAISKKWSTKTCTPTVLQNKFSCWYSIKKAVHLKKEYEEEHQFKYDFVIVTRYDIYLAEPFDMYTLNHDHFYVAHIVTRTEGDVYEDNLIISNSENIDIYAYIYDDMHKYVSDSNHIILTKHLQEHMLIVHGIFEKEGVLKIFKYM